ncbi:MAG: response regulator [Gammaproteobacteria bacterium]|nr:response regulator [Gammaproteobacteria bacterium]
MKELKKILYVEDEEDIRTIAQVALEDLGKFTVKICSSGQEAIEEAEAFSPDLLLLDVMMPGMDGPATLQALRSKPALATTPAIFMTAKAQNNEIMEYRKMGVLDVIIKPFDPMKLASDLKECWKKHRG